MANGELVARVKDFFGRQIAWYEQVLDDLGSVEQHLAQQDLDGLVQQRDRHAADLERIEREFSDLAREWEAAAAIDPADRDAIHAVAQQAEALAAQVASRYECAQHVAGERLDTVRQALGALGRGRGFLRKYRIEAGPEGGGMVDRQA